MSDTLPQKPARLDLPKFRRDVVTSDGEQAPVRAKNKTSHVADLWTQVPETLACGGIPQHDGIALRSGGYRAAGVKGNTHHMPAFTPQSANRLAGLHVPEFHISIHGARDE
jgi:hypothetical protein